jgi:hypothetical protein
MTLKQKVALYEAALNSIAAWGEGPIGGHMDEPGSAREAREVLALVERNSHSHKSKLKAKR